MTWIQLRSRRDPAFWLPLLLAALVLVPVGLWSHVWLSAWSMGIQETAAADPAAARDEAARLLRLSGWAFCAISTGFCACFFRYFQLGRLQERLPPSGWWSLGAHRAAVGITARRLASVGLLFSALLLAVTIGFALALEHILREAGASV